MKNTDNFKSFQPPLYQIGDELSPRHYVTTASKYRGVDMLVLASTGTKDKIEARAWLRRVHQFDNSARLLTYLPE